MIRPKGAGVEGCGDTPPKELCNKGTALAGPTRSAERDGLQPPPNRPLPKPHSPRTPYAQLSPRNRVLKTRSSSELRHFFGTPAETCAAVPKRTAAFFVSFIRLGAECIGAMWTWTRDCLSVARIASGGSQPSSSELPGRHSESDARGAIGFSVPAWPLAASCSGRARVCSLAFPLDFLRQSAWIAGPARP